MKTISHRILLPVSLAVPAVSCVNEPPDVDGSLAELAESEGEADVEDFLGGQDDDELFELVQDDADDDDADTPAPWPDELANSSEPSRIIGGAVYDSERDVRVEGIGTCTGTLLRNNVVLTAKHCVSTDGSIGGPELDPEDLTVRQDGPGATMGSSRSVLDIARMADRDVALLRLSGSFWIDGASFGQSTQILATDQSEVVGDVVLCQGYGRDTCDGGGGVLRSGLVEVDDDIDGMLKYRPWLNLPWIQWKGDSGSSCRWGVLDGNLSKALGVASTAACGVVATETGPELYRAWAVDQMNAWAGGTFLDTFGNPWPWFANIDIPSGILQGPPNWRVVGGVLTENSNAYTSSANYEGTRYINGIQVASDAIVRATISSADNDGAGLIVRYRDPTHYYRFSLDEQRGFARIVRRNGSTWTVIAEDNAFDIDWSEAPRIGFYAWGGLLAGMVNGRVVAIGFDGLDGYTAGRAGMYTWGLAGATFDDFEIERL